MPTLYYLYYFYYLALPVRGLCQRVPARGLRFNNCVGSPWPLKICTAPHAATMSGSAMNMNAGMCVTISSSIALPVAGYRGLATVNSSVRTVTGQCMGECGLRTDQPRGH